MIFYFSGTGNSEWAAVSIAALTKDQAWDITNSGDLPDIRQEKQIGFVFPVYAWGAPEPMSSMIRTLPKTDAFTFAVCTCGEEAGNTLKKLSRLYPLNSSYSLVMPNNYIIGSEPDDDRTIQQKLASAREEIERISGEILKKEPVCRVHAGAKPWLKSTLVNLAFNRFARTTKAFRTTDACSSCGLCARRCPASAISMVNGRPHWEKQCFQCLRCINECPETAIEYGTGTEKRKRYTIKKYL